MNMFIHFFCLCPLSLIFKLNFNISKVVYWMNNDKLLLNDDKTEFLMIGTKQQLAKVNIDHILIGDSAIRPKGVVKNLGTWLDSTYQ